MTEDILDVAAGDDRPRPILLGEAPSKHGDRFYMLPLSGRPARVLCELAGIPPQPDGSTYGKWTWALYERFACRNVFRRYAEATPWSAPAARDQVRALLEKLEREWMQAAVASVDVPDGTGTIVEETYRRLSGAAAVKRLVVAKPQPPYPVIVCLGRKVQSAVFGAIDGDVGPAPLARPGAWGDDYFGNFGVWTPPWRFRVPIRHADESVEQRWAPHVVTIPHPSGLNRVLNDDAARRYCGNVLRAALDLADGEATVPE